MTDLLHSRELSKSQKTYSSYSAGSKSRLFPGPFVSPRHAGPIVSKLGISDPQVTVRLLDTSLPHRSVHKCISLARASRLLKGVANLSTSTTSAEIPEAIISEEFK